MGQFRKLLDVDIVRRVELMSKKYPFMSMTSIHGKHEAFSIKSITLVWEGCGCKNGIYGHQRKIPNEFIAPWQKHVTTETPQNRPQVVFDLCVTLVKELSEVWNADEAHLLKAFHKCFESTVKEPATPLFGDPCDMQVGMALPPIS